jgi:carboxyl-terminal processing protease
MIRPLVLRFLLLLLSLELALPLFSNQSASVSATAPVDSAQKCNPVRLAPGPIDGKIAFATANLLDNYHYSKQKLNRPLSAKFFDHYLEALDGSHMEFLQSDLAEFDHYRTNLNELTLNDKKNADTKPAFDIFNRFMERHQQRVAYVDELLKTETFTFDADDRITINRHESPYPKDLDEAKRLWRERLRFEYLQEKLARNGVKKKAEPIADKKQLPSTDQGSAVQPAESQTKATDKSNGKGSQYDATKLAKTVHTSPAGADSASQARARDALRKAITEHDTVRNLPAQTSEVPGKETEQTRTANSVGQSQASSTGTHSATNAPKKTQAEEIVETLTRRYHRNLRLFTDWNSDDVIQVYLTTLARVYDPHSDYYGHQQLEQFSIGMNLSLTGIGAELTLSDEGYCTIRKLLPGGPAEKSKQIKVNDRITAVAQGDQPPVDIVEMSLNKAVQLIRGPKGTEVRLTILPGDGDGSHVLSLVRDEIKLEESEAKSKVIDLPDTRGQNLRLGVIDLPSFYATFDLTGARRAELAKNDDGSGLKSTTTDVSRLLKKMKEEHVQGVILDLRRNGGGSLEEAIRLTGLFIKEGPVVQVRNTQGAVEEDRDPDPDVLYEGPIIVLTSRFSASASEIVAGALQDYGRAVIVGDASTHGKGTVQSVNPLKAQIQLKPPLDTNDPGALKLTIKAFYRASGVSTQLKGVIPDIILPSVFNESKDIGEAALDNPLHCEPIQSAKYDRLNLVEPYLPDLRKRSAHRVAEEKDFDYVREDIEYFKKQQADKTISLNESTRVKEKEEIDARQKARDKERLARAEPLEKIHELTLRQVDLPGLPPPVEKTNSTLAKLSGQKSTAAGVSTNSASVSLKSSDGDDSAADADEEKPPFVDVDLNEAEHILIDYLSVLPKQDVATAGH